MNQTVSIDEAGTLRMIHDDDLTSAFADLGGLRIERASHVEPDAANQWWADMAPWNGPVLGPFKTRGAALDAERGWLEVRL